MQNQDSTEFQIEGKQYRRDRGALVLFSLIVIVYNFADGYISSDPGTFSGGISLLIGVKFNNPFFIELMVVILLFYTYVKFRISSNPVKRMIQDGLLVYFQTFIAKAHSKVSLGTSCFKWYGPNLIFSHHVDEKRKNEHIKVFVFRKYYLTYLKSEILYLYENPEYLDYYTPNALMFIALISMFYSLFY